MRTVCNSWPISSLSHFYPHRTSVSSAGWAPWLGPRGPSIIHPKPQLSPSPPFPVPPCMLVALSVSLFPRHTSCGFAFVSAVGQTPKQSSGPGRILTPLENLLSYTPPLSALITPPLLSYLMWRGPALSWGQYFTPECAWGQESCLFLGLISSSSCRVGVQWMK